MRGELKDIAIAPFSAGLRLEGPATSFDVAIAYAGVVAEACAGVVVLGDEVIADRRASELVWSGPQIEERWRAIDAEAARSEPGYQPVRDLTDDHRPTQTFTFPIVLEGLELTAPIARGTQDSMTNRDAAIGDAAIGDAAIPAAVPASDNETTAPAPAAVAAAAAAERRAAGSAPPPMIPVGFDAAASNEAITATMAPAPTVPVQVQVPLQAMNDRRATGERRSVQMPAQTDEPLGFEQAAAAAAGEDDWSDVMPD